MSAFQVTAQTTDEEIRNAARKVGYKSGIAEIQPIMVELYTTQRRVAILEQGQKKRK
jgi:hypothetical protein